MKKRHEKYIPIQVQALQPNGEWHIRTSFIRENENVQLGMKTREWLINKAIYIMNEWRGFDDKLLQVSGQAKPVPKYDLEEQVRILGADSLLPDWKPDAQR